MSSPDGRHGRRLFLGQAAKADGGALALSTSAERICGNNNWYYAYGRDFDAEAMRRDAAFLAELAEGHRTRPYCVIDAGWTPGPSVCPGCPWTTGDPVLSPTCPGPPPT